MSRCRICGRPPGEECENRLQSMPRQCNVTVTMEDKIEAAARRTAINLMRLNEALELKDAESYPLTHTSGSHNSPRYQRIQNVQHFYKRWFTELVEGPGQGSPDKGTPAAMEGSGPSAIDDSWEYTLPVEYQDKATMKGKQ